MKVLEWKCALACALVVGLGTGCSQASGGDDADETAAGAPAVTGGTSGSTPLPAGSVGPVPAGAGASGGGAGGMAGTAVAGSAGSTNPAGSGGAGSGGSAGSSAGSGGSAGSEAGSGGSAGSGGTTAMGCSGKPGMLRGKSNQTLMAGGIPRTFIYYAPMTLDANKPAPIVIVPHGYLMTGQMMYDITQYSALADKEGFVALFPDGAGSPGPWNVGQNVCGLGASVTAATDDQSFITAMLDFVKKDQCVDEPHIFMSGFSMGGYFSNENGCQRADIRAIGPHSGGSHDLAACPQKKKPVILFHFDSDSLITYDCSMEARDRWVARNGCMSASPDVVEVMGGRCEYYKGCPADGQVALCTFQEPAGGGGELIAGHAWAGGSRSGEGASFAIPQTASATDLGWAFFKKYAW